MCSLYRRCLYTLLTAALAAPAGAFAGDREPLAVCADPNNLPFSNRAGEGFENALAEMIADELGRDGVRYEWRPQRRGFIRNTLKAERCDVVMGVPAGFEMAATTRPYYRSTYVFVTRAGGDGPDIEGFDDPRLRDMRIGVHVIGDDYSNTPPARALARQGLVENIRGYTVYGDYSEPNPPSNLITAVAEGEVDVAVAWGPLAGYFAERVPADLALSPVAPQADPASPMVFDIAMGVRHGDDALRSALQQAIAQREDDIRQLLRRYGVPLLELPAAQASSRGATP